MIWRNSPAFPSNFFQWHGLGSVPARGDHHVPEPRAYDGRDRPEPAPVHRLVADQHLGAVTDDRRPGAHHLVDRAAATVEVPEPGLPTEQCDALEQGGMVVEPEIPTEPEQGGSHRRAFPAFR